MRHCNVKKQLSNEIVAKRDVPIEGYVRHVRRAAQRESLLVVLNCAEHHRPE
jgi:hypothetical protein